MKASILYLAFASLVIFCALACANEGNSTSEPGNHQSHTVPSKSITPLEPAARTAPTIEDAYPKELGMVSSQGTQYSKKVIEKQMLPKGSAILTSSGLLKHSGIQHVIHAASGSSSPGLGAEFEPTLESVALSIKNSLILASRYEHKTVALPFIGGSIFLQRIGVEKDDLVKAIVQSALEERSSLPSNLRIRFITFGGKGATDNEETALFKQVLSQLFTMPKFRGLSPQDVQVLQGDITDFSLHQSTAIVNAANMEGRFGGGISGAIAAATGARQQIDQEAAEAIRRFNRRALERPTLQRQ